MNLYIRFIYLILKRIIILRPIDLLEESTYPVLINPLDLDFNFHVNNGRYFSIMDLGRFDLLLKAKVFWKLTRAGYFAVVSSESIRFKRPLNILDSIILTTKIEAWDERSFYIKQRFIKNGEICAEGYIKGCFCKRGHKGAIPTKDMFNFLGKKYTETHLTKLAEIQKHLEKHLVN